MVDPGDVGRRRKEQLELPVPNRAFHGQQPRLKVAEPIGVKINMLRFVTQKERARFLQDRVARYGREAFGNKLSRLAPR